MAQQTAVEWLHENNKVIAQMLLDNKISQSIIDQLFNCFVINLEQAKEMEKEQLNIARIDGINLANKGYGSKGSDDQVPDVRKMVKNNLLNECVYHNLCDRAMCPNKDVCVNCQSTSSQTEISDEEIEEASLEAPFENSFKMGAKWYREQLKKK